MRTAQVLLVGLLTATLVLLPVVAGAETATKAKAGKSPAGSAKATAATPRTSPKPATAAAKSPAAPATAGAPALSTEPGMAPLPPVAAPAVLEPTLPSVMPEPRPPAVPAAPSAGAMPATGEPVAPRPNVPYNAYINADVVNVRSGPGLYYYPVAIVGRSLDVVVEGESGDWLAVRPFEGVCGLMKKADLTVSQSGKSGTVVSPTARVYSSGDTAKRQWCVMAALKQGDTVEMAGPAEGEFVKVKPPESARVYVAAQYVAAGTSPMAAVIQKMAEPPKVDPLVEEYTKLEAAFNEEQNKPLGERDFKAVAAGLKEIGAKTDKPYLKRAVDEKLAVIAALDQQQAEYKRVTAIGERLEKRLADLKSEAATKAAAAEQDRRDAKPEFTAVGMLQRLESLEDVDYPIKFKLVDQQNHPLVVLKSTVHDLNQHVGKVVGVRGAKTYLKEWRIYLVTVDDLEVKE